MKNIAILGSTGSIGTQALDVISSHSDLFYPYVLVAKSNYKLLVEQALKYKPKMVVITDANLYKEVENMLEGSGIQVAAGEGALDMVVALPEVDIVLTAMVGFAGLRPTIRAIEEGKDIALANKETLVVAGEIIMQRAKGNNVNILPVDSEHSAIFQCLVGESHDSIEKIILTASGGPFRGISYEELKKKTKEEALKHPNWNMGAKITIDSATLMNKGLEVIEARWLFDVLPENIDVVVHPQSIIHSLVQFVDGSIKAQMGLPDMKLPILYALSYPMRIKSNLPRFDFTNYSQLSFEKPDMEVFKNLASAYYALNKGGNLPCVLNAANEVAVELFLEERIGFTAMFDLVLEVMNKVDFIKTPSLDDLFASDEFARKITYELAKT